MARKKSNYQDRYMVRMQGGKRGLVEATSKMDIHELRVFMTMLTMVMPEDNDFVEYEIKTQDIIKLFSLNDDGRYYEAIRDGASRLFDKKFVIFEEKEDGLMYKTTIHLIDETSEPITESEQNRIRVKFNPKLKPYLLQLQREYLTIDVRNIMGIQSPYSIKLYIILKHQFNLGNCTATYTVERLREILAIEEGEYPLYGNFKQSFLKKGMADMERNTDLRVIQLEEKKEGRAVHSLVFHLESKVSPRVIDPEKPAKPSKVKSGATGQKENEGPAEAINGRFDGYEIIDDTGSPAAAEQGQAVYEKVKEYVSLATVQGWFKIFPVGQIDRGVAYAMQQAENGRIKNVGAYLQRMVATPDLIVPKSGRAVAAEKKNQQHEQVNRQALLDRQIEQKRATAFEYSVELLTALVRAEEGALPALLAKFRSGLFGSRYRSTLSLAENMQDPVLAGGLISVAKQLYAGHFTALSALETEIELLEKSSHSG